MEKKTKKQVVKCILHCCKLNCKHNIEILVIKNGMHFKIYKSTRDHEFPYWHQFQSQTPIYIQVSEKKVLPISLIVKTNSFQPSMWWASTTYQKLETIFIMHNQPSSKQISRSLIFNKNSTTCWTFMNIHYNINGCSSVGK